MRVSAILSVALAALLLSMPAIQLVWLAFGQESFESAFVLAYLVLGALALLLLVVARRFATNKPGWSNVGKFVATALGLGFLACAVALGLAFSINVVDSSHGGSFFILVLGAAGLLMLATGWLLAVTRRQCGSSASNAA